FPAPRSVPGFAVGGPQRGLLNRCSSHQVCDSLPSVASSEEPKNQYAERMFPAPIDHGIARDDRAVSTVESGVDTAELGSWQNDLWYQGGGRVGEKAVESIVIYPPTRGMTTQGDPFEPV